jgi:hypothetical protein
MFCQNVTEGKEYPLIRKSPSNVTLKNSAELIYMAPETEPAAGSTIQINKSAVSVQHEVPNSAPSPNFVLVLHIR